MDSLKLMKEPGAFLPVAMSGVAIAMVAGHVALYGPVREADEGVAAHIFQLLMVVQVPIAAFFAIRWFPRFPRQALQVLPAQAAAIAALALVFYFKL